MLERSVEDATALRRGVSRSLLIRETAASEDATALRRGASRSAANKRDPDSPSGYIGSFGNLGHSTGNVCAFSSSKRETPRRKAVASSERRALFVAASVRLHGARPWHLLHGEPICSSKREPPP